MNQARFFFALAFGSVAALTVSCGNSTEEEFTLTVDEDERRERRRQRMNVRVIDPNGNDTTLTPEDFTSHVNEECLTSAQALSGEVCALPKKGFPNTELTCEVAACVSSAAICAANRYLELGSAIQPMEIDGYVVPPQSNATKSGFSEKAAYYTAVAIAISGEALRSRYVLAGRVDGTLGSEYCGKFDSIIPNENDPFGQPVGPVLIGNFGQAISTLREAVDGAVQRNVSDADTELARTSDRTIATRAAWHDPFLSRGRAAQLLYGSIEQTAEPIPYGLPESCALAPLTSRGRTAMDYIRRSGVAPSVIRDSSLSIGDFLTEDAGVSVIQRIRLLNDLDQSEGGDDVTEFLRQHSLSEADFAEARAHLRCQLDSFPTDETVHKETPYETELGILAYSATRRVPRRTRGPALWADVVAVERSPTEVLRNDKEEAIQTPWVPEQTMRGAAYVVDYARRLTTQILTAETGALQAELLSDSDVDSMAMVGQYLHQNYKSRVTSCADGEGGSGETHLYVLIDDDGEVPLDSFLIVAGEAGADCAVRGTAHGETCVLRPPLVRDTDAIEVAIPSDSGFARRVQLSYKHPSSAGDIRDYVALRRSGLTGRPAGGYRIVAPVVVTEPSHVLTHVQYPNLSCDFTPAENGFDRDLEDHLGNDPHDLPEPNTTCEEMSELPVPLEAELSDDGDRYETQWRRQLQIAQAAAEQADALGEQYISAGLGADARAESAQRELEALCGVSVDLSTLFDSDLTGFAGGPCSTGCGSTEECVGGVCVLSLDGKIEAARDDSRTKRILNECLGNETIYPLVSLGAEGLCVWRDRQDVTDLCNPNALPLGVSHPCPWRRQGTSSCAADVFLKSTAEAVSVEHRLELFDETRWSGDRTGGPEPDEGFDCGENLRHLRGVALPSDIPDLAARIASSNHLTFGRALSAAEQLGWRGEPGNHFVIESDYAPRFWTGDPTQSEQAKRINYDGWPCKTIHYGSRCPPDSDALFCQRIDCESQAERGELAYRTARAMATLGLITGFGWHNLQLPLAVNHNPPAVSPPLGASEIRYYHLGDECSDDACRVLPLVVRNSAGYSTVSGDAHNLSGRGFSLTEGEADLEFWSGFAVGRHISNEVGTRSCTGGTDDPHWGCPLTLSRAPSGDDHQREYRMISFANFADTPFKGENDPSEWVAGLWQGMSNRGESDAEVRYALRHANYPHRPYWAPSRLGVSWLDARTNIFDGAPITHVQTDRDDVIGVTKGNFARLFDKSDGSTREGMIIRDVLDALELVCYAHSPEAEEGASCMDSDGEPPALRGADDLPRVRNYLKCMAGALERSAERMVLQNVPRLVVEGLRDENAAIAPLEGRFGESVSAARQSILGLREQPRAIATQIRAFEADLAQFELQLRRSEIDREIIDWRIAQEGVSAAGTCGAAAIGAAQGSYGGLAHCAAALANLGISFRVRDLQNETIEIDQVQRVIDMQSRMEDRIDALQRIDAQVALLVTQLDANLAALNVIQGQGRRLLADSMFHGSVPAQEHMQLRYVSGVTMAEMRRYNTAAHRYRVAHRRARRAAVLARQSIEQRLGMRLRDMDNLILSGIEPRDLEREVCSFEGIDYARIRDEGWVDGSGAPRQSYADGYIGDYVRELQAVMDSYPYRYPYTDGTDVAVVSLRDDMIGVGAPCEVESRNLLRGTADFATSREWVRVGCDAEAVDPTCVSVRPLGDADTRATDLVPGPRISSGVPETPHDSAIQGVRMDVAASSSSGGAVGPDAALRQTVTLDPGVYRLSWYGRTVDMTGPDPGAAGFVTLSGDAVAASTSVFEVPAHDELLASGWRRFYTFGTVSRSSGVTVSIDAGGYPNEAVELGGFMLERSEGVGSSYDTSEHSLDPARYYPGVFTGTDDRGMVTMDVCEDTFGVNFRANHWSSGCDRLCSRGFGEGCTGGDREEQWCYWGSGFSISQKLLNARSVLARAGFAFGNFNYRIERIGVNIVGRRDCSGNASPSTCYASGTAAYSLHHDGPFSVTNHNGETREVSLFDGSIEHARALNAERYITNPISSADRSVIEPYMRDDFQGRPLDGNFRFRVWDLEGMDFSTIEDVQFVIEYRYWNRSRSSGTGAD